MIKWIFVLVTFIPSFVFADLVEELSIGEMEEEFSVIDESFIDKERWIEAVFPKTEGKRNLASVFSQEVEEEDYVELSGQLRVVNEIPYTQPSQYRWVLKKKVLRNLRRKKKKSVKK